MAKKIKNPKLRRWIAKYVSNFNYFGFLVGSLFLLAGFFPSLLPRGWVLQGVISAILFSIGYGIGVVLSWVIRSFGTEEPDQFTKNQVRKYTYWAVGILYVVCALLGEYWQREVARLVEMKTENVFLVFGTAIVTALLTLLILFISRNLRTLFKWIYRQILRVIPRKIAYVLALVITVLITTGIVNGVILDNAMEAVNNTFSLRNDTTDEGVTKPDNPERSGSDQSLIPWDSLGRQGRKFISQARDPQDIGAFNGQPAKSPVRVYAGLASAGSTSDRAALAVRDLQRAGGFDRKIIVVVTTTGTGWVDEEGVNPIEYMYNGDSAVVSMQYSYLPSWLSFLVDQKKARDAGVELYYAVLHELIKIPIAERPKLVVFGESLGSFGSEAAFSGESAFKSISNGAVYAGPPNFNSLRKAATEQRDAGTPEILPIVQDGEIVRFAGTYRDFENPPSTLWRYPRAAYLENPSDPIVWWSPDLLFNKPDWLSEPRGHDVSKATSWFPIVTFWHITGDMVFSTAAPDGHGHKYGKLPTDAWGYVAPPPGWNAEKTAALKAELSK